MFAAGGFSAGENSAGVEVLLRRLNSPEAQFLPVQARGLPETAELFLFFPDPAALASVTDAGARLQNLPIRQGWISAQRQPSPEGRMDYELAVVFLLAQVESPRSVELLLRLMLTLWLRKIQMADPVETLKAVTFSADAQSARIESLFLESAEIASFLKTLLPENLGSSGLP
jgi:hypothetical protein